MKFSIIASAAACAAATSSGTTTTKEAKQVHIMPTGRTGEMHVSWAHEDVTSCPASGSTEHKLAYGPTASLGKEAIGHSEYLAPQKLCVFGAVMTGLKSNTEYHYKPEGSSKTVAFTFDPAREKGRVYAVLADFGLVNDQSMEPLITEAANNDFDVLLHAGDYAYNLDSPDDVGNKFMAAIEPVVSQRSWFTCPGNHESDKRDDVYTFANYRTRFPATTLAAKASGSTDQMWYSVDDGLVHIISLDSELVAYGGTESQIAAQAEWLKQDLAKVDRSKTPWVVTIMHKQYWMDKQHVAPLNTIMKEGGVDVIFCGHSHLYERQAVSSCMPDTNTYHDCKEPIIMVVGSPGCKEKTSTGFGPNPAYKSSDYGYGHLQVHNATHMSWKWEEIKTAATKAAALRGGAAAKVPDSATISRSA